MNIRSLTLGLLTTCAFGALATAALADPPERVGRISYVEGEVSFQPPQEDFWTSATRNFPVATGEAFWTGDEGRAELQIGSVAARLDNETELDVVDVDYGATRLSLAQGSLDLRLWRAPRGGVVIATPAGDIRLDYAGSYRIDVGAPQDDGSYPAVEVTVFEGSAQAPSPDGAVEIDAGEAAMIYAGYQPQEVDAQDAAIDDWAREREQRERWNAYSDQSPGMTGVEDLESYGQFEDTADYGQVWFPRDVDPDWAPYKYGHWASVNPWGWTWIDDQPWGFAPFHYGRWAQIDGRWGWVPGRRDAEPVYSPALVAFIGGSGWGAEFGGGEAMGWVPLAPDEAYRPDYQVSDVYERRMNAANVNPAALAAGVGRRDSVDQFRNARAAVVVRSDAFARGAPVQRAVVSVPAQALTAARVALPASRPAPSLEARSGVGVRTAPGGPRAGSISAPPPPQNLQAVRRAVIARPSGAYSPPAIPGASLAPPRPQPGGTTFVAPSQLRHPEAQARQPAPVGRPIAPAAPAPGVTAPRATPLRALPKSQPAEGYPPSQASPPTRFERPRPGPSSGQPYGQPSGQPVGPGAQPGPGPDAAAEMRARAAEAQARRNAAQQEQMRLQQEQGAQQAAQARAAAQERARIQQEQLREQSAGAPQQRNPAAQPLRAQPDQRRPQTGAQPAEPTGNKPAPPSRPKYRIGPDGKPIPVPPGENPRQ